MSSSQASPSRASCFLMSAAIGAYGRSPSEGPQRTVNLSARSEPQTSDMDSQRSSEHFHEGHSSMKLQLGSEAGFHKRLHGSNCENRKLDRTRCVPFLEMCPAQKMLTSGETSGDTALRNIASRSARNSCLSRRPCSTGLNSAHSRLAGHKVPFKPPFV